MGDLQKQSAEAAPVSSFEQSPWLAAERTVEDPQRAPEPPLQLEADEHVFELAESDSLRRAG